jgi:hypothetical protein
MRGKENSTPRDSYTEMATARVIMVVERNGTLDTTTNNSGWWVALGPQTTTQKLQIVPLQQRMVSVLLTTAY